MYVCIYLCMHVLMYLYRYIWIYVLMCVHMDVCIYVGTYVCICIYLYKDMGWRVRSSSPDRDKLLFSPPKVQTVSGAQPASLYFPGKKWQRRDVNHPPPSSAEVKIEWSCAFAPRIHLHGVDRDHFIVFIVV